MGIFKRTELSDDSIRRIEVLITDRLLKNGDFLRAVKNRIEDEIFCRLKSVLLIDNSFLKSIVTQLNSLQFKNQKEK